MAPRLVQDAIGRHHHPEVNHVVVVAAEHDPDDVLADVVHVALHGGHQDALATRCIVPRGLVGLDERHEVGHRPLHDPGALDDLRKKHLPLREEVANDAHSVHQGAFDHIQRVVRPEARLLGIGIHELDDALDEGVHQSLAYGSAAPFGFRSDVLHRPAREAVGELNQPLGRVGTAIEQHVLHRLEQFGVDRFVDFDLARVHDAHVHSRADGMVQERRMHRLPHPVVAAEREGNVGDSARNPGVGQVRLDPPNRLDVVDRVPRVRLNPGRYREDVRIEDDVLRRHPDLVHEQVVGPAAHRDAAFERIGLPLFVEGHHDDRGAVRAGLDGLFAERGLPFLQADRVDDRFALQAAQTRLDHAPAGRIEHHGYPRYVGLGHGEVQEPDDRFFGIEQALVHVDIDHLGAGLDLLPGHFERLVVLPVENEPREFARSRDVRALPDIDEVQVVAENEGLETGYAQAPVGLRRDPGLVPRGRLGDRGDVLGSRPAASADDVQETLAGVLVYLGGHECRRLIVPPEGVRQARVRVETRTNGRDPGDLLDMGPHLGGTEGAVEPDRHEFGRVRHRDPEGLGRLAGERASAEVGDRARDHDGQTMVCLPVNLVDRVNRCLGVQGVENRLDEQDVGAAVDQAAYLLLIGRRDLFERDRPVARVIDVGRQGERAVERANRSRHETGLPGRRLHGSVRGFPGEAGRDHVQFVGKAFGPVVGLRDAGRAERIGFDDIGPGREVFRVDRADEIGLGEAQQVVVALEQRLGSGKTGAPIVFLGEAMALDHGTHRPVDHEDAALHRGDEGPGEVGILHVNPGK